MTLTRNNCLVNLKLDLFCHGGIRMHSHFEYYNLQL